MFQDFNALFEKLSKEWQTSNTESKTELLSVMWVFQQILQDYIDQGKEELRAEGVGEYSTTLGTFTVKEGKTIYVLKDTDHNLDQRLGHYFNLLFRTKVSTHPKFEEVYAQLPQEMKDVVFRVLEQKTHKARVSFTKRGEK